MSGRVLLTGGSGVLGRATVPVLVAAGWQVDATVRSVAAARTVRAAGATPVLVDLLDVAEVRDAAAGHDAIVHLATAVPPLRHMHRHAAWIPHHRLRVDATRAVVAAARAHGIPRVVKESVTFPYCDGGDRWLDESAPVDPSGAWRPTLEGEQLVTDFTAGGGTGVVLRLGQLYAADARSTEEWRALARWGLAPLPGRPDAFVSSTHADDAADALRAALTAPAGTYNVVDDRPLRRREYLAVVSRAFGRRTLRPVPTAPMRWVAGDAIRGMAASQRVCNRAFVAATGWRPHWTDATQGWAAIARTPGVTDAVAGAA